MYPLPTNTPRTHLEFIQNCHIKWKFCVKRIGKLILLLSSDRSFNSLASSFKKLNIIKIEILHTDCINDVIQMNHLSI